MTPASPNPTTVGEWTPSRKRIAARIVAGPIVAVAGAAILFMVIVPCLVGIASEASEWMIERRDVRSRIDALHRIAAAQEVYKGRVTMDADGDGVGEYGTLRDLLGRGNLRESPGDALSTGRQEATPALELAIAQFSSWSGGLVRAGYLYRVDLPGPGGRAGRNRRGSDDFTPEGVIDPDSAETTWCCYAWPADRPKGRPVYFLSRGGALYATDCEGRVYTGWASGPRPGAAFTSGGLDAVTGAPADGELGQDGNVWVRVN